MAVEQAGDLDVILDGSNVSRATIETTGVDIVAFDKVTAEHAFAEDKDKDKSKSKDEDADDRTLAARRRIPRNFHDTFAAPDVSFHDGIPVVCPRFHVVYSPITLET